MRFTREVAYELAKEFEDSTIGAFLAAVEDRGLFYKSSNPGGRKDGLTKERQIKILRSADQDGVVSRASASWSYLERLTQMGFLSKQTYSSGKPGKRPIRYVLTGKGRSRLALSRKWDLDKSKKQKPVKAKTKSTTKVAAKKVEVSATEAA